MSSWKKVKLDQLAKVSSGKRLPKGKLVQKQKTSHPYIRVKDFEDGSVNEEHVEYIDEETHDKIKKYIINSGEIYISNVGTIGLVGMVPDPLSGANLTENAVRLHEFDENCIPEYIMFYLQSKFGQDEINKNTVGSTQPKLPIYGIKNIDILLPDLITQEKIVTTLLTLKKKLEINKKMNEILEEMAMTLYKHWFVDFGPFQDGEFVESELGIIPKGWEVVKLKEIVNTQYGYTASANENKIGPHFLRITDIQKNFVSWDNVPYCEINEKNFNKYQLKKGDIVIARTGNSTGKVGYINTSVDAVYASFLVRLQPKSKDISPHYLFLLTMSHDYQNYLLRASSGTTRKGANAQLMTEFNVALPPSEIIKNFHKKVNSILEQIEFNISENTKLKRTRDFLLPKLLSGEIDLSSAENEMEQVT